MLWYHIMHQRLCANYISVDRETVRVALKSLNPELSFRQAHQFHKQKYRVEGPNQLIAMTNWSYLISAFMSVLMGIAGRYYGLKFVLQIKIPVL